MSNFPPPTSVVEHRKNVYRPGTKVVAVRFSFKADDAIDDNRTVPPGTEGVVTDVDDFGTVHVNWSNHRRLGVLVEDQIAWVEELPETRGS